MNTTANLAFFRAADASARRSIAMWRSRQTPEFLARFDLPPSVCTLRAPVALVDGSGVATGGTYKAGTVLQIWDRSPLTKTTANGDRILNVAQPEISTILPVFVLERDLARAACAQLVPPSVGALALSPRLQRLFRSRLAVPSGSAVSAPPQDPSVTVTNESRSQSRYYTLDFDTPVFETAEAGARTLTTLPKGTVVRVESPVIPGSWCRISDAGSEIQFSPGASFYIAPFVFKSGWVPCDWLKSEGIPPGVSASVTVTEQPGNTYLDWLFRKSIAEGIARGLSPQAAVAQAQTQLGQTIAENAGRPQVGLLIDETAPLTEVQMLARRLALATTPAERALAATLLGQAVARQQLAAVPSGSALSAPPQAQKPLPERLQRLFRSRLPPVVDSGTAVSVTPRPPPPPAPIRFATVAATPRIPIYEGPSSNTRLATALETGAAVEILERRGTWCRVGISARVNGWEVLADNWGAPIGWTLCAWLAPAAPPTT